MIDLRRRRQQVSAAQGRPIAASLRRLVYPLLALLLLVGVTAVGALQIEANEVNRLTLALGPAVEANGQVLQAMTDADTGLRGYQVSHNPELLAPFRGARARTMAALATMQDTLALAVRDDAEAALHTGLEDRQRLAVEQWWAYALSTEQAVSRDERTDVLQGRTLFDRFRAANATLGKDVTTDRDQARSAARTTAATGTSVSIAATLAALLAVLVLEIRSARSMSRPITELNDTMTRQHRGEPVGEQRAVWQPGQRIVQRPVGQFRAETKVVFCECVESGGKGPDLQGTLILASERTRLAPVLTGHRVIQLSNRPAQGACGPDLQD